MGVRVLMVCMPSVVNRGERRRALSPSPTHPHSPLPPHFTHPLSPHLTPIPPISPSTSAWSSPSPTPLLTSFTPHPSHPSHHPPLTPPHPTPPQYVRVELSSEANLWFLYLHEIDEAGFHDVQDAQRLMLSFREYPALLVKLLNSCLRDPRQYLGILSMQPQLRARLDFLQILDYKFVEHLSGERSGMGDE